MQSKEHPLVAKEKSRDIYAVSERSLLVVYTDRLYADEVEMPSPLPGKGVLLNQISNYWMNRFPHLVSNYLFVREIEQFPPSLKAHAAELADRSVIVHKIKALPFRFLVLGSIGGAAWQSYRATGAVQGQHLPRGLKESDWLEQSVVIPLPVGDAGGRGEPDGRKRAQRLLGQKLYAAIEEVCLAIFGVARNYAAARGLTLADARFEFSQIDGKPCLINEVLTPDVATYWPGNAAPGTSQPVFERQNLYTWLDLQKWNKKAPGPDLPPELLGETIKRYQILADIMTGKVATLKKQEEAAAADEDLAS